ncbi:MAG: hypothetical protein ABIN91_23865 [Mucilaginibacter sp.]|uniref:hypothetical protein n=1 Tax=Mucilaginibacter sp. TaxID=1882438 RepID=UPI003265FA1A
MEQNLNTDQKDFFSEVIANPTEVGAMHAPQLKSLVDLYPQSGILRAMLARASQIYDESGFQQKLKSAAVYAPDRAILYNLINYPEKLIKYVAPFNEIVEEEEVSLFEDEYSNYQHEDQGTGYEEEQVYESEPINYFHESEEEFQYTAADRTNFNPVAEPEATQPQEEDIAYNYPPAEPEIVQPQEEDTAYNFPPAEPETVRPQEEYTAYNFPSVEPETVRPQEEYTAYNYPPVEEVTQQPVVSDYDYTPPYRDEVEEPQAPPGYTYNNPAEPVVPPVPGYHTPLSYQEQIAEAATEAGDEVYDEIADIEDVKPIIKSKSNVPDITDIEGGEIEVKEEKDENEEVIMAQYGQQSRENYLAEKPKLTKAEQELADFLAQGPEYINTIPGYVSEEPQQTYTEPEPVVVEDAVYNEPEPKKEYITETDVDVVEEDAPDIDIVDFEMIEEPVVQPVNPVTPRPMPHAPQASVAAATVNVEPQFANGDDSRVSKYNDDKMPYSFMWWLDKVRQEHAETHQPYVPFKPIISEVQRLAISDDLQQQYFENIFHITSVEQLDMNTRDKRKESEIIDRFIQKDPQLKPPNTEKLDNENKAKNSAEDKNELVSETLARIYLDQMLYTKAISTYQKLMLKFPEKSSYFVAQIKLLEKKIN